MILLSVIFLLAIILEGSFISIPFVLLFLLFLALRNRQSWIFFFAFFSGIFLDSLFLRNFGATSIFFLIFIFAVTLYERKFEIKSLSFVVIASFVGTFIYFSLFGNFFVIQKALFTSFIVILLYKFLIKPRKSINYL